ncbi:DNA polymerase III, alpha subunit subfamily, putative [Luminiphilus syltensis NOR5-1B]|uniref:DNA polymerase III subunit alpha n=1 Tax=Luminiphilus syltensis NOR5-1B TaxID=565045 RepID=B8KY86_9GAMM|nr:DNA polymerase III, alpha subunit subfamily, putative [Luminiphilus syltensis NOR5-1B]
MHTEYSLVDGLVKIKPLMSALAAAKMPAVAITDLTNFYGLIKAYKAAASAGIKLIVGADFWVVDPDDPDRHHSLCLLAQDETGYQNLTTLITRAWRDGQHHGRASVQRAWLGDHAEGLIALSGGRLGHVGQLLLLQHPEEARQALIDYQRDFPDRFYIELQRTGRPGEEDYIHAAVALAAELDCPVVATNDVRFLTPSEFEAHEARVCIGEGRTLDDPRRPRDYSEKQFLRSAEEMAALFSDIPEAIENTVEIARRCSVSIRLGEPFLPNFPVPEEHSTESFLAHLANEGLAVRLRALGNPDPAPYQERLDFELKIINEMGFPGYFLVVMDFIRWAKQQGIPVGPGRGSGAGSLVAYALEITDLDPLTYDLLFERFLNPQRVSMPDFDVDFCMDRRDEVIDYVADMYGREAVSQIITFGTMAAKAVVRDVARVQDKPFGLADKMSKLIPFEVGMTLEKALRQEDAIKDLLREDSAAQEIWDMAVQLEGATRNVGKHAGGVVIAPSRLTDFSPLYCDEEGGGVVTQYDKNDVEEAGLVKFDFLGLRTLTIIDWAVRMIDERRAREGEAKLDISTLPLDDPAVFKVLQQAETTAVFQLESRGMKELIKRLKPDCFEDIIALVALFRPGPLQSGMVDNFIDRKHGREQVSYPDAQYQHPVLQPILEPTYGIILYQEQVMQIAQELAGYTLGGADLLRRAMGKKKLEEMAKQRSVFAEGASRKGIDPDLATRIFDLVEKFAGYGFNKSHSAAYALVSYQTAWLKAHYPAEFMAAVMSSELDNTDKLITLRDECKQLGITVRPPDANEGEYAFSVNDRGEIIYGLGAIKGLGEGPVESILAARNAGPFVDLFEFCDRTDPRKVNRRAIEALINSGALDGLGVERWIMMSAVEDALRAAEQAANNTAAGMGDLFGDVLAAGHRHDPYEHHRNARPWSSKRLLNGEKESIGSFLSGHPMEEYEAEVRKFASRRIRDLQADNSATVAGLIVSVRTIRTQRGVLAVLGIDDGSGQIEATVFADIYSENRELLEKDRIVLLEGRLQTDEFSGGLNLRVKSVRSLEQAREGRITAMLVRMDRAQLDSGLRQSLRELLLKYRGGECPICIDYQQPLGQARIRLGSQWQVTPTDSLLDDLRGTLGNDNVELLYEN